MKTTLLHTFRSFSALLFVLAVALSAVRLDAGVEVYPLSLFINAPNRTASVSISNPTDTRQEIWVEYKFGYPVANDSGKFEMHYVEPPYTGELSAVSWLKAFPQRFVLNPKESQLVRIMVSAPANLTPAEYWARIVVSSTTREVKKVVAPGGAPAARFQYISQIDIPLHYRFGSVTAGLTVKDVSSRTDTGNLVLSINLTHSGNASYWGTMTATLKNQSGKVFMTQNDVVAIYKDMHYPATYSVKSVPPGTYTLELAFTTKRHGLASQFTLRSEPVKYSTSIVLP